MKQLNKILCIMYNHFGYLFKKAYSISFDFKRKITYRQKRRRRRVNLQYLIEKMSLKREIKSTEFLLKFVTPSETASRHNTLNELSNKFKTLKPIHTQTRNQRGKKSGVKKYHFITSRGTKNITVSSSSSPIDRQTKTIIHNVDGVSYP